MILKRLPFAQRILLDESSATEDILDAAIRPALTGRKARGDLVCLKDGGIRQGDTRGEDPQGLRRDGLRPRSAKGERSWYMWAG